MKTNVSKRTAFWIVGIYSTAFLMLAGLAMAMYNLEFPLHQNLWGPLAVVGWAGALFIGLFGSMIVDLHDSLCIDSWNR